MLAQQEEYAAQVQRRKEEAQAKEEEQVAWAKARAKRAREEAPDVGPKQVKQRNVYVGKVVYWTECTRKLLASARRHTERLARPLKKLFKRFNS